MANWRLTSQTIHNITEALDAGVWGENRSSTLEPFSKGDRLAFYSSAGGKRARGFVATGTVAGDVFKSDDVIWMTGLYPFRLPIQVDEGPLELPVDPAVVLERLGQRSFENMAPRKAVIALTDREFDTIETLVRESVAQARS
jgi:hypothetical protein